MLGKKIKEMRENRGILQKEVAEVLRVNIAYVSKMEHGDKPVSKSYLSKLALLYDVSEKELYTLWLADKVYDVVKDQDVALKAIEIAEKNLNLKNASSK
jgi:transcriptional regulator with XRE-family HTH domain